MIRIDAISKRHGAQILFLEASAAVNRGEKIGLVGPNGSGKTTIFRLITREEEPDAGQIAIDRGVAIGYFSQDIGEMKDQSVLDAALDGAGAVSVSSVDTPGCDSLDSLSSPVDVDELGLSATFPVGERIFTSSTGTLSTSCAATDNPVSYTHLTLPTN